MMYILRGNVPRPVRTVRGDKELEANCCLYVGFQLLIPPDLVNRSTSPCRGTGYRKLCRGGGALCTPLRRCSGVISRHCLRNSIRLSGGICLNRLKDSRTCCCCSGGMALNCCQR